jgi:hypothetical protein
MRVDPASRRSGAGGVSEVTGRVTPGWAALAGLLAVSLVGSGKAADAPRPCFDFTTTIVDPLRPPIPMIPDRDNSAFGTYANGVHWSATRARINMPITELYARLLDHRNHKDMKKTVLSTSEMERPGYLRFQRVDVVVTLRALFFKKKIAWAEEWGFTLTEGTREAPRRIVASYQKVDGTRYLKHQCGSYVLQALEEATADLSMYDEVIAEKRNAEDTRKMQAGILENIRRPEPPGPVTPIALLERSSRSWSERVREQGPSHRPVTREQARSVESGA